MSIIITPARDENARIRRLRKMDKTNLSPDGGPQFNRLIFTGSPYLLQHAENPVAWYPWGAEAFDKAVKEDKPIFLSIGYATCHWCHVMAHESFEDWQVAEVLNRHFIAIKVDREERPDVDDQYMTAAHLMNVSGGWPLNVVMNHDRRPFFIATYIPRNRRPGMLGIIDVLGKIADVWVNRRGEIAQHGQAVIKALAELSLPATMDPPGGEVLAEAYRQLNAIYDRTSGGFGSAPKFPMPTYLSFLVRYSGRNGSKEALGMVEHTLRAMRKGGIYDQIGYGFHRYSVDQQWLVPHFEKMLYDQALLAIACLDAFQATGDVFFREVAGELFDYVKREMTNPEGGFYSALDADSEGKEGTYYLWTPAEVETVIGSEAALRFCRLFGVTRQGNFEGQNILTWPQELDKIASREQEPFAKLVEDVAQWRRMLLHDREQRVRPLRDEKIITAWNGLMIAALARGYGATGVDDYRREADQAITFIREKMTDYSGRLLRIRHSGGEAIPAFLEDYAFFCWGVIELYQATLEPSYLTVALQFTGEMLGLFRDPDNGGLFEAGWDVEPVLVRTRGGNDGVTPSGSAVAAMNLLRLGRITKDAALISAGEAVLRSNMSNVARQPANYVALLSAFDYINGPVVEITLSGGSHLPDRTAMLQTIGRRSIPGLVIRSAIDGEDYPAIDGRTTVYLCAAGACRPPIVEAKDLELMLDEIGPLKKC